MIIYLLVGTMLLGTTPVNSMGYKFSVPFYEYVYLKENSEKIEELGKVEHPVLSKDYKLKTDSAMNDVKKPEKKLPKEVIKDNSDNDVKVPKFCSWDKLKWSKGNIYGAISIPTINVKSNIIWGATQDSVDNNDIAISRQAGYCGSDTPVIIMGHNTNSFSKLKNIKKGAKVIIKTQYGVYIYEIYSIQIAKATSDGKNIVNKKGEKVIKRKGNSEVLQLYTCYDSNGRRFVAKGKKIKGTKILREETGR